MKNPWMSAWLSAANSMTGAAKGQMMKAWMDALDGDVGAWRAEVTG